MRDAACPYYTPSCACWIDRTDGTSSFLSPSALCNAVTHWYGSVQHDECRAQYANSGVVQKSSVAERDRKRTQRGTLLADAPWGRQAAGRLARPANTTSWHSRVQVAPGQQPPATSACQLSLPAQPVIMVPTPSSVRSSISSECGWRPSMMWVALTPWLSDRMQQSTCTHVTGGACRCGRAREGWGRVGAVHVGGRGRRSRPGSATGYSSRPVGGGGGGVHGAASCLCTPLASEANPARCIMLPSMMLSSSSCSLLLHPTPVPASLRLV